MKLTHNIQISSVKTTNLICKIKAVKNIVWLLLLLGGITNAQQKSTFFSMNGSLNISYENYASNASNYTNFRPRYPEDLFRLNGNAVFHFGKYFSIPVGVNFSNQENTYYLPTLPEEGVYNYIRNPRNNFHINPTYKWARVNLGSQMPQYSEFTSGDMQIFGVGMEINPKKFILSASYGTSQYAVEPNPIYHLGGAYEQQIMSARIGYGKVDASKFTLNVVKLKDDTQSVKLQPIGIHPHEGISFAPMVEIEITENLKLKSEIAASVFTENLLANDTFLDGKIPGSISKIITINNSTVLDYAHVNKLTWHNNKFGVGVEVKYVGPGFMSVGYRNIEKDILDYKLLSNFKLFNNKLLFNGVIGLRTNNLSNTKLTKNNRVIGNVNLQAQLTNQFSINANYSNFGFRNNQHNNLYRIEMMSNAISITPTYQFKRKTNFQQISVTASIDQFSQYDQIAQSSLKTDNKVLQSNYLISFNKIPLNMGVFGMYLQNKSQQFSFNMENVGLNLGYVFMKKKIKANLFTTFNRLERKGFTPDDRLNFRMKIGYKMAKNTRLNVAFSQYNNRYGSYRPDAQTQENKFQISLTQKF